MPNYCVLCRHCIADQPHKASLYSGRRMYYYCGHPEREGNMNFIGFGRELKGYVLRIKGGAPGWCPERTNNADGARTLSR